MPDYFSASENGHKAVSPKALRVVGDDFDMGRAHGAAARDGAALDCARFFSSFVDDLLSFQVPGPWAGVVRRFVKACLREGVERELIDRIPSGQRGMLAGFSSGAGISIEALLRAYVMPDVYAYLLGRLYGRTGALLRAFTGAGCTSFVSCPTPRGRGAVLVGRNLDFPGGERWSAFPAVIEYRPSCGLRFASVTSLGVPAAGITAFNEAGLSLSLHMNYSRRVSCRATPVLALCHEVMRSAKTLRDAVDLISSRRRSGGWSFVLASVEEHNALVLETDAEHMSMHGAEKGTLVYTNHYLSRALGAKEYWTTPERRRDSEARFSRVRRMLADFSSPVLPEEAAAVLGDSLDPHTGRERAFGSTVCEAHTVLSAVFDLSNRKVFVADGPSPTSKRGFTAFDVFPGPFAAGALGNRNCLSQRDLSRREYVLAQDAYFPNTDYERVARHIGEAVRLDSTQGLYWTMSAFVQLKRRRLAEAKEAMRRALECDESPSRRSVQRLYEARIDDLGGEREAAEKAYGALLEDPNVGDRARRNGRVSFRWKDVDRLFLDFTLGEALEP